MKIVNIGIPWEVADIKHHITYVKCSTVHKVDMYGSANRKERKVGHEHFQVRQITLDEHLATTTILPRTIATIFSVPYRTQIFTGLLGEIWGIAEYYVRRRTGCSRLLAVCVW